MCKYFARIAFAKRALPCACIQLFVDINNFLSSLLTVPGIHHGRGSSTDVLFKFKLLILWLLNFASRRSLERDGYLIAQRTYYDIGTLVQSQMGLLQQEAAQGAGGLVSRAPAGDEQGS